MKKILLLLFFLPSSLLADQAFLVSSVGASAKQIASAYGFEETASAIFDNPAGLDHIKKYAFSGFYTSFFSESQFLSLSSAIRTKVGTFAIGFYENRIPDNIVTDLNKFGEIIDTGERFSYKNTLYKLGFGKKINDLQVGFSLNYMQMEMGSYTSSGINGDIGVNFPIKKATGSLLVQNCLAFNPIYYSNGVTEKAPTRAFISFKIPFFDFAVFPQIQLEDSKNMKSIGLSYTPHFLKNTLYLSGTFKEVPFNKETKTKWVFGTGISILGFEVGVAYEKSEIPEQDNQMYFSSSVHF